MGQFHQQCAATAALAFAFAGPAAAAALTEAEQEWLAASEPVLAHALRIGLPLDVVVQPRPRAGGDPPLGMAYVDGRCKFVLSLRGNARAEEGLQGQGAMRALLIEAMAAHELAHCWRHVQGGMLGAAGGAGLHAHEVSTAAPADATQRLEEGYADLAALAWVRQHHRARYAQVHAWLSALREPPPYAGSPHDTGVWLRLARERPAALDGAGEPYARVLPLWEAGAKAIAAGD